jgi:hypothetical protein
MFFQELPGLSKFKFYPINSLPLLSHIPVEELRNCAIARLRDFADSILPSIKEREWRFYGISQFAISQFAIWFDK